MVTSSHRVEVEVGVDEQASTSPSGPAAAALPAGTLLDFTLLTEKIIDKRRQRRSNATIDYILRRVVYRVERSTGLYRPDSPCTTRIIVILRLVDTYGVACLRSTLLMARTWQTPVLCKWSY
jgi:hypothetical protein